jgi:hypothetical protein
MRTLFAAALLAAIAPLASADTVYLKNGGKLEGVTTKIEGDRLIVKTQNGTVKLTKDQVQKVVHAATAMEEYELAAGKLKKDDAKGHFELANWCGLNKLPHYERVELEATIAADPEHKMARERLGYENVGGKWLRGEELMKARGLIKVDGKWTTKEQAAALEAEKEKKRLERELAEAERKAEKEEAKTEYDRIREFYESQQRVQRRLYERGDDFDRRRAPRSYPRRYYDWYSDPWSYGGSGSYYVVGTVGYYPSYGYGYYPYYGYSYDPYYGGTSIGFSYNGDDWSVSFGTNFYADYYYPYYYPAYYGSGYRRYVGGSYSAPSSYGPFGTYVAGSTPYNPGYYSSSGAFNRGLALTPRVPR